MSIADDDDLFAPLLENRHPTSTSRSFEADGSEEEIRRKLQWYFKNPYEKYKERKRKPAKLVLQIIKIILVTAQVC